MGAQKSTLQAEYRNCRELHLAKLKSTLIARIYMRFEEEDLIAYLLGDAGPDLASRIDAGLGTDASLRDRIAELRQMLGHMDSLKQEFEPPADLIGKTLARIDSETGSELPQGPEHIEPVIAASQSAATGSPALSPVTRAPKNSRRRWDTPALALSVAAVCCLILPGVLHVRYQARTLQCASNLMDVGRGLQQFAVASPSSRYPTIPVSGPAAFSGSYVARVRSAGIDVPTGVLVCPSLIGFRPEPSDVAFVAGVEDLAELSQEEL
ncbi:MAG TPA: hypothetical protein DDW52_11220, partial [Planctomycetaceae bacterium]|nr:hypothetical protein [Planctomycetaceae bacterium]